MGHFQFVEVLSQNPICLQKNSSMSENGQTQNRNYGILQLNLKSRGVKPLLTESKEACYEAFRSKDARFDGRFFGGVSSTGIYCRPICRAKLPKYENMTFFATAAEAEQAGYRPCMLCRPELAPGNSIMDASSALAQRAARLLDESCGSGQSLELQAKRLGCTDRHLRRVFEQEYHVTPVQYLQTRRLLMAKNLLTDTNLPVLEVAMAAGFGSVRRMNDLFQKHYRLSPTDLRKSAGRTQKQEIAVNLDYRPPYRWAEILKFLAARAIPGVEAVLDGCYARTVSLRDRNGTPCRGWFQVGHLEAKHRLRVTLSESLVPVLPQLLYRVRRLFDLDCNPDLIYETLQRMNELRPGLCVPGTRVPGCFDAFETSVRAILGQQIMVKAASTLAGRLAERFGAPVKTGIEGLTRTFPGAEDILALGDGIQEQLGVLGVISARSGSIRALAEDLTSGAIDLSLSADPEQEMEKLQSLRGIGGWTAQYIAMRTMGWPDAFLDTDVGVRHALTGYSARELLELAEQWRPWRSYATVNLWNTL